MSKAQDPYDPAAIGGGPVGIDTRQAWIASDYLGVLASQAGYAWHQVRSEADVHSLDGTVTVQPGGSVFVQVKGHRPHFPRSTSYTIKEAWRKNWQALFTPAYFVVVTVPNDVVEHWVEHSPEGHETLLQLSAYWTRIDPLGSATSIRVFRQDRLTTETFDQWRRDYLDSTRRFGMMTTAQSD